MGNSLKKRNSRRASTSGSDILLHPVEDFSIDLSSPFFSYVKELGRGTFGRVDLYTYKGNPVAVKKIVSEGYPGGDIDGLFDKEQEILRVLNLSRHPNIVQCIGIDVVAKAMIFEFAEGGSLENALFRSVVTDLNGRKLSLDVARGVFFLHSQTPCIIHRDIKTANVLLTGDYSTAKICDVGLARKQNDHGTVGTVGAGTSLYMAPEVWEDNTTEKVDIYSLGMLFYELFSYKRPWSEKIGLPQLMGLLATKQRPDLEPVPDLQMRLLIMICWSHEPKDRPTAGHVVEVIEGFGV